MSDPDPTPTIRMPDKPLATPGDDDGTERFVDGGFLGRGGSAIVRSAFDRHLLRHVAIKQLTAKGPRAQTRFLTEAQITAQLEHPHIVPVHEHGADDEGRMFMSMKLVSGNTLWQRIEALGPRRLEPNELAALLAILGQVCDAVAYAHSRGVIHRDLKPTNVMVGDFGRVYLMDWGIARVAETDREEAVRTTAPMPDGADVSGTPAYMAPEQGWEGEEPEARIDVYSLGGLLYAILTGRAPNAKGFVRRLREPVVPPGELAEDGVVPPELARIAMKALERDPDQRYPDVQSFKNDLLAFQNGTWQLPVRRFSAGELILTEGDPGDEAFLVVRGRCRVEREGEGIVEELGPGGVFGELAVLTGRPRDASIRAATDVVLQVVSRETLTEGLGLNSWAGRFVQALAKRVVDLHTRGRDEGR